MQDINKTVLEMMAKDPSAEPQEQSEVRSGNDLTQLGDGA